MVGASAARATIKSLHNRALIMPMDRRRRSVDHASAGAAVVAVEWVQRTATGAGRAA
jgi:hypothetical protein